MGIQPFKREMLKKKVFQFYQEGNTFREIAKMLDLSPETVRQIWLSTQVLDMTGQKPIKE